MTPVTPVWGAWRSERQPAGRAGPIWRSPTATASDWPDLNGPAMPNSAAFVFDFTVGRGDITPGGTFFFNLVFGDYDIDPAVILVRFANAAPRILRIPNQQIRGLDGLI